MPQLATVLWLIVAGAERLPIGQRSWAFIGPSSNGQAVIAASVAFDPVTGMLYAGSAVDQSAPVVTRVFRKPVDGGEWVETASPELGGIYPSVEVVADPSGAVYAASASCVIHPPLGCGGGLARTEDGGATWMRLLGGATSSLAVDPSNPATILGVRPSEVQDPMFPGHVTGVNTGTRSVDRGATWQEMTPPPSPWAYAFDPNRPGVVFATTVDEGVWKSLDSGATWLPSGEKIEGVLRAAVVDRSGTVFVASDAGVFASRDGGDHWEATALTLAANALAADPLAGGAYAGTNDGVFHVDSNGAAVPVGTGLSTVWRLAADDRRVWAATLFGVFEYDVRTPRPRIAPTRRAGNVGGEGGGSTSLRAESRAR